MSAVSRIGHWIGGRVVGGESGRTGPVFNPATGAVTGRVLLAEPADVDAAVRSGVEAFAGWSQQSLSARSKVLFAFTGVAGRQCAANC